MERLQLPAAITAAVLLASAATAQDIVRIASPNPVTTLDPIRSAAAGNIEAFGQLYARLLRRDETGALQPALAESWAVSDDGLTYTFELRAAKFSDGSPLTAEDVAFSLNRVAKDPESAYPAAYAALSEVVAVDADTVELRLEYPAAPMLDYMEIFNAGIVSKADVDARGADAFAASPLSSGPFMVQEWRPNDRLILAANPNYWREGYPLVAGAELIEVSDSNARASMILAGEVEAVRAVPYAQVAEVDAADDVAVPLEPSTVIYVVLPNHTKPPFDDADVRRAAAMALDRQAIAKAISLGMAKAANSTLPEALAFYAADLEGQPYDPAAARAILEEKGLVGTEIVMLAPPDSAQLMTLLKAQWDAVGFMTKAEPVDTGLWWDRLVGGDYNITASWWYNETMDPDLAARWALCGSCGNNSYYTNYNNPRVDELTEAALRELDPEKRGAMYREIQEITVSEVSQVPLWYAPFTNAYSSRIEGLRLTPALQWTLEETRFTK
ncbi:MAG: ABC transporter substrate-binding protein [Rhodobacter sp.]|nr:ABC transporter substrate-binding protein [Rhodobacter sp.]